MLLSAAYLAVAFHRFYSFLLPPILFSFNLKHTVINYQFTIQKSNYAKKLLALEKSIKLPQ